MTTDGSCRSYSGGEKNTTLSRHGTRNSYRQAKFLALTAVKAATQIQLPHRSERSVYCHRSHGRP